MKGGVRCEMQKHACEWSTSGVDVQEVEWESVA